MIEFRNVSISFDGSPLLLDVNVHIKPGEFVSIVGESGVGKTTMLRLIYFDLFPDNGIVRVGSFSSDSARKRDIPKLRRTLGIVFQDYKLLEDRTVFENIAFVLRVTGAKRNEVSSRVLRALADVGLSHKRNSMPEELSGGEQQRVVFARALTNQPQILLADEPTGNLDMATSLDLLRLMKTINVRGTTVVLASHNIELVKKSESRIIQIGNGVVTDSEWI